MRSLAHGGIVLLLAVSLPLSTGHVAAAAPEAQQSPAASAPTPNEPTPSAGPPPEQPCGTSAARFESGKSFTMVVTRAGQVQTTNPLRPLTPEVNEVLLVVIGGKVATAYGPDFTALRRGSAPAAIEAMLGGPIKWQPSLPTLPDSMTIVSEEGAPLAQLAFRTCETPPAVRAPRTKTEARKKVPARRAPPKAAAEKTPPGFSMPQGAIAE
ncbi:hypothetical protein SAMN05216360_101191 [Methylobacterium phyllostachyos]|uniref:Uncharacterized protein n=1 Tax=Methylobacterium phyllostachyos TaxID=582672 RepID=A0A1G9RE42_9HYPH|nr:hypothetical protein [Methylobacterium phyllostachyos]SDM20715.1 hypothetical protein SAMN05216360_101191 [Methylobacterium phyllostachyos]